MSEAVLDAILSPLATYYSDPATVEVRMNEPCKIVTDRRGEGKKVQEDERLVASTLKRICMTLANRFGLHFHADNSPKLSCLLPEGHRFECLVGSSVQSGLSLAIRCKHPYKPAWQDFGIDTTLQGLVRESIEKSYNIIISGATNTGKTTLLNMMLATLPASRRVIAVEDTPELELGHFSDSNGLLAARGKSMGMVSWRELYDHAMRITPDHLIFGEISTENAFAALGALNSGNRGFMCTIHAESPEQALTRKFEQNIAWAGEKMEDIPAYLRGLIDMVIQIKRDHDGYRRVSAIYMPKKDEYILGDKNG